MYKYQSILQSEEWIILIILISITILIVSFIVLVLIIILNKRTTQSLTIMKNSISQIRINIKEKTVYIKHFKGQNIAKMMIFSLEDYIYMISLNPDSKKFREFLKLINNGNTIKSLKIKFSELDSIIPFIIEYPDDMKRISMIQLNTKEKNINKNFIFQSSESVIDEKWYGLNFMSQPINFLDDKDIFLSLKKEMKVLKTKGMTLISLKAKENVLFTERDYSLNQMDFLKVQSILKAKGIVSFISKDGKLYFISNITRKSNYYSVQKEWENKIQNIFDIKTKYKYTDLDASMFDLSAMNESKRDANSLNIAIIKSLLFFQSSHEEKEKIKFIEKIITQAIEIDNNSRFIIKELKNNKDILKGTTLSFKERKSIKISELYLDFSKDILADVINMSFRYKEEIIINTLSKAIKIASNDTENIFSVSFNFDDLVSVSDSLTIKNKQENLLLNFINYNEENKKFIWKNSINNIKNNNFYFTLNMNIIDKKEFDLMNLIKPNYIILHKDFSYENLVIPENFIIQNKKNKIKILNLI